MSSGGSQSGRLRRRGANKREIHLHQGQWKPQEGLTSTGAGVGEEGPERLHRGSDLEAQRGVFARPTNEWLCLLRGRQRVDDALMGKSLFPLHGINVACTSPVLGTTILLYEGTGVSLVPRCISPGSRADPHVGVAGNIALAWC